LDKFPEAFQRFEQQVETKNIQTFAQLVLVFRSWSGERWKVSPKMVKALAIQAQRLGIPLPKPVYRGKPTKLVVRVPSVPTGIIISEEKTWRWELITVKGKPQDRYRDLRTGRFISKTVTGVRT